MQQSMPKKYGTMMHKCSQHVLNMIENASWDAFENDAKSIPEMVKQNVKLVHFWSVEACKSVVRIFQNRGFVSFRKHWKHRVFFISFEGVWLQIAPNINKQSMLNRCSNNWCKNDRNISNNEAKINPKRYLNASKLNLKSIQKFDARKWCKGGSSKSPGRMHVAAQS